MTSYRYYRHIQGPLYSPYEVPHIRSYIVLIWWPYIVQYMVTRNANIGPPNPSPDSRTRCTQISRYSVIWGHPRMTPFEPKRGPKRGQNANILTLIWSKSSWMIWAHLGPPFWTPYWAVLDPFWVPPKSLYFVTLGVWIHVDPRRCIAMHRRESVVVTRQSNMPISRHCSWSSPGDGVSCIFMVYAGSQCISAYTQHGIG